MYSKIIMLLSSILLSSAMVSHADIYKYIDSKGVLHFTNMPTSSGYEIYIREKPDRNESPEKTTDLFLSSEYDEFIKQACETHGIDVSLVKAMIKVESDFNNWAISKKGAKGLMQIMPDNYKRLKIENPFNPWENIMGGTKYMKMMIERFDGKLPLALAAYNAGPTVVDRFNDIPPYSETENYVKKVMEYYNLLNNER